MKKLLALLICVLFLSSCNDISPTVIEIAKPGYSCYGECEFGNDTEISFKLNVLGGGVLSAEITKPLNLKGLKLELNNGEVTANFGEIKGITLPSDEFSDTLKLIEQIFLKITTGNPEATLIEGEYVFEGKAEEKSFTFTLNSMGFPEKLSIPSLPLNIRFYDFEY